MKSRCEHNHITRARCGSRDGLSGLRTTPERTNNRTELMLPPVRQQAPGSASRGCLV